MLVTLLAAEARAESLALPDLITVMWAAEGEGVVAGEAARALGLRSSTMAMLGRRLEQKGLVIRAAHPGDGRLVLLCVTPAGQELLDRVRVPVSAAVMQALADAEAGAGESVQRFLEQLGAVLSIHGGARAQRALGQAAGRR
jgi:DNA-binding MarR family transcriptional regulator